MQAQVHVLELCLIGPGTPDLCLLQVDPNLTGRYLVSGNQRLYLSWRDHAGREPRIISPNAVPPPLAHGHPSSAPTPDSLPFCRFAH